MRLTLRPEWRLWPLSSFLGLLDLKTGVTLALLFAVGIVIFLSFYPLLTSNSAAEQGRRRLWTHRCPDWSRGIVRPA